MGTATEYAAARLEPILELDQPDGHLLEVAEALFEPKQAVDDVVRDTDTEVGWARALDPQTAPTDWLPWLAQFPGVPLPPDAGEEEQRERIEQAAGLHRGRPAGIVTDVQRTLTGTKAAILLQQVSGDQWAATLITRTAETPDPDLTVKAALEQKPAGVVLTHIISDDPLIDEGTLTIDDVTVPTIDNATIADVT